MRKSVYFSALMGVSLLAFGGAWVIGSQAQNSPDQLLSPAGSIYHEHDHNHLHGLGFHPDEQSLFLATHFGMFVLKDSELFQLGATRDDFMGFSLHPQNPEVVYTSGHPRHGGNMGVMKSVDGGATYEQIFTGLQGETVDFHSMTVSAADADILFGAFQGSLYRSTDGGENWDFATAEGLPAQGFCWGVPCLHADPHDPNRIYAGTPGGLMRSDDQGERWTEVTGGTAGAVVSVAVAPDDAQLLIAHTQHYGVARSVDAGETWESINTGLDLADGEAVFQFVFDPEDANRVFLATTGDQVYQSVDQGQSWDGLIRNAQH